MLPVDTMHEHTIMGSSPTLARSLCAQVDQLGSKKEGSKGKKGGRPPPGPRVVRLEGGKEVEGMQGNNVKTAKYNVATFLPIFLFEMFSRIAYLYFLLQARRALLLARKSPVWDARQSLTCTFASKPCLKSGAMTRSEATGYAVARFS